MITLLFALEPEKLETLCSILFCLLVLFGLIMAAKEANKLADQGEL